VPIDPVQPTNRSQPWLPVFREDVQVHKRLVDTGRGVRIHKTVAEHPCHHRRAPVARRGRSPARPGGPHRPARRGARQPLRRRHAGGAHPRRSAGGRTPRAHQGRASHHPDPARGAPRGKVMLKAEQVSVERFDEAGDRQRSNQYNRRIIMQHTLVAVFDNHSDAQSAMDELLASGFTRSDVNCLQRRPDRPDQQPDRLRHTTAAICTSRRHRRLDQALLQRPVRLRQR
jgi:hypothetical protein